MYTAAASITNSISSVLTAGPPGGLCAAGKNLPVPLILLQPPYLLPASPVRVIETIWGRILACNRPMIAAGITLILAAVLLRRIPRLSKEDWIINSRRTITGLGILLIALSFTAGNGNGFGVGSGDGIGIGDETSSGSQQTQEDPDPDGEQDGSDDMEQDAGADRTGNSENPDRLPTLSDTETVIRIRGKNIYCQEQQCMIEELEEAVRKGYKDGMVMLVQDDYADDITYSQVIQILETYKITREEETL